MFVAFWFCSALLLLCNIAAQDMANLTRVNVIPNPQYQRSGPKSYVSLLRKYNFAPTKEGPYFVGNKVQTRGTAFYEYRLTMAKLMWCYVLCHWALHDGVHSLHYDIYPRPERLTSNQILEQAKSAGNLPLVAGSACALAFKKRLAMATLAKCQRKTSRTTPNIFAK